MRNRQRPAWTPEQLATIYAGPHDHRVLGDGHTGRVDGLVRLGREVWPDPTFVADLSAGNGVIARGIGGAHITLGDFAPHPEFQLHGPIEDLLDEIDPVDVFVCAETLEHLDDPDLVLRKIRVKANALVCSVPICETPYDDLNGEHYWAFDRAGAEAMLRQAGWDPVLYEQVTAAPGSVKATYECGLWACLRLDVDVNDRWVADTAPTPWTSIDPGHTGVE